MNGSSKIFMTIFVALGAILMVLFYFVRALILFLPAIIIAVLVIMIVYSIRKYRDK